MKRKHLQLFCAHKYSRVYDYLYISFYIYIHLASDLSTYVTFYVSMYLNTHTYTRVCVHIKATLFTYMDVQIRVWNVSSYDIVMRKKKKGWITVIEIINFSLMKAKSKKYFPPPNSSNVSGIGSKLSIQKRSWLWFLGVLLQPTNAVLPTLRQGKPLEKTFIFISFIIPFLNLNEYSCKYH